MSREESPRTIRVSKAVKAALVELRLLEQVAVAPVLDSVAVDKVERELDCRLPDDILATFAAGCDAMRELGMALERVVGHTREAHAIGCGKELIAIGKVTPQGDEAPDYFCVARQGKEVLLHEVDAATGQVTARRALADFIQRLIDERREEVAPPEDEEPDEREAELEVGAGDLDGFRPRLTAPPAATGRRVRHATFGVGDVLREIGSGDGKKLEVKFDAGVKVLIARVLEEL